MKEADTKSTEFRSITGVERDASDPEEIFAELVAFIASIQTLGRALASSASAPSPLDNADVARMGELIAHQAHTAGNLAFDAWEAPRCSRAQVTA